LDNSTSDIDVTAGAVQQANMPGKNSGALVGWVMDRVARWRNARDSSFRADWEQFYYIWRGKYNKALKQKQSERSRLIAPATQMAVDQTVAEMVEAIFGRGNWFDVTTDVLDKPDQKAVAVLIRDRLLDDMKNYGVKSSIIETLTNGAVYGTGIAKRVVDEREYEEISQDPYGQPQSVPTTKTCVKWESIPPHNFVIDTAATNIEEALGVAHETIVPIHVISERQKSGEYFDGPIGAASGYTSDVVGIDNDSLDFDPADGAYFTEYHGKVPRSLLDAMENLGSDFEDLEIPEEAKDVDTDEMVEAIICIANGSTLLKANENPILGHDRGFVAYQHHKCPNRFWGIGVAEKAYNPQVALDAELRARIDALGLLTYPVMGADATRLPRNLNLQVTPGKVFMTNGRPSEVLEPIKFGNLDPATFQQSGDFERMVEGATGAYGPATPTSINSRNETSSGMSMLAGSAIKRAKLTMHNVDVDFLGPMVKKSLYAYMQFDSQRYPFKVDFVVNATMSIMAREFEQMQLTNLLAIIPPEAAPYQLVLKAIVENMSGPSRDKIVAALDAQMQPDPKKQQMQEMLQQLQMQQLLGEVKKLGAEVQKIAAETQLALAKAQEVGTTSQLADEELNIKAADTVVRDKAANAALLSAHASMHKAKNPPKPANSSKKPK